MENKHVLRDANGKSRIIDSLSAIGPKREIVQMCTKLTL